jgi:hypothetical protein
VAASRPQPPGWASLPRSRSLSPAFLPAWQGDGAATPQPVRADITGGALQLWGLAVPLPIRGSGKFEVRWAGIHRGPSLSARRPTGCASPPARDTCASSRRAGRGCGPPARRPSTPRMRRLNRIQTRPPGRSCTSTTHSGCSAAAAPSRCRWGGPFLTGGARERARGATHGSARRGSLPRQPAAGLRPRIGSAQGLLSRRMPAPRPQVKRTELRRRLAGPPQ